MTTDLLKFEYVAVILYVVWGEFVLKGVQAKRQFWLGSKCQNASFGWVRNASRPAAPLHRQSTSSATTTSTTSTIF